MDEERERMLQEKLRLSRGARRILGEPIAVELLDTMEHEHFIAFSRMPKDASYEEMKVVQLSTQIIQEFRARLQNYVEEYALAEKEPEQEVTADI